MKRMDCFRRQQGPHKDPGLNALLAGSHLTTQRVAEERCFEEHGLQNNSRAGATPVCAALEPPQTRFVPIVTSGGRSRP